MDLTSYRDEFPGLQQSTYLNTCSLGQLPRRGVEAARDFEATWQARGASAWYDTWWETIEEVRASYARVLGARPEEVAWLPNVSVGLSSVAGAVERMDRMEGRDEVVVSDMDFPTQVYAWTTRQDRGACTVRWARAPDKIEVPIEGYTDHLSERTALVATSRVFFTSGYLNDVEVLADACHDEGALCLIDDYQATGQVPIDVHEADVDILVGGSLKWLLGGIGSCFLYVREGLHEELVPDVVGWFGNEHMFDFDVDRFAFRPNARRFETGEINLASVHYAKAGMEVVHEIGPKRLREATMERATDLIERARDAGFQVACAEDPDRRTGIVMLEMDDAPAATEHLAAKDIIVDHRPGRLRISPYFYNTVEENERVVEALVEGGFAA